MRRREFMAALGGVAAGWPLAARAQPQDRMRRLGVLMGNHQSDPVGQAFAAALGQGLGALGWHEGRNLRIDWRWGAGDDPTLFERYAKELVALAPDALFAQASPSVAALRRETSTIPIVFTMVTDPIGQGFVASLAQPGGNVTGFSDFDVSMAGKWLGMLTQVAPPVARVSILYNPATTPYAGLMLRAVEQAAPSFAVATQTAACHDDTEIETLIAALAREERGGLLVLTDIFNIVHQCHRRFRRKPSFARGLFRPFVRCGRWSDVLRHRLYRPVPALRGLCRSHPERRQGRRSAGSATD